MLCRRTALSFLLALSLAPATAGAQDRTASAVAFGGASLNSFSTSASKIDFGVNVGKELTPNIQAIGEVGRVGDMLPSLSAGLLSSFTPYDVRVSAFYGEGGIRLLAAPNSGVNPVRRGHRRHRSPDAARLGLWFGGRRNRGDRPRSVQAAPIRSLESAAGCCCAAGRWWPTSAIATSRLLERIRLRVY